MENYLGLIIIATILFMIFMANFPIRLWIVSSASGAKVKILELIGMKLRKVPPEKIIYPYIMSTKAYLGIPLQNLEAHYLAGGSPEKVIKRLIAAQNEGRETSFETECKKDFEERHGYAP